MCKHLFSHLLSFLFLFLLTPSVLLAQVRLFGGSTDRRYNFKDSEVLPASPDLAGAGWRGETVYAQVVVRNEGRSEQLCEVSITDLKGKGRATISKKHIQLGYVDEVIADTFSHCGTHDVEKYGRFKQADRITRHTTFYLPSQEQRGIWVSIDIPRDAQPGRYEGEITLTSGGKKQGTLPLTLTVSARRLPAVGQWRFHLDFWQNPYAVARWHGVPLWSQAHFDALRPYMQLAAASGQKVITATLINRPWNGQTQDAFGSMIEWRCSAEGQWSYDFSTFDRWVSFMMSCGIDREITCFSMIPWALSFQYYDTSAGTYKHWQAAPGDSLYSVRWGHFLEAFHQHLSQKGWLSKTTIAMDERSLQQMQQAIALIKQHAPGLKISMAGNYHPEIEQELYDYCVDEQSPQQYTTEVIARRRAEGKLSTYYTCCSSRFPNVFTFSPPAEGAFIPLYALHRELDGYLRWAYNSWTTDPDYDSRFRAWSSGDTYIVYPNALPSVRWARLKEGIQLFEKYHLLYAEAVSAGDRARVARLDSLRTRLDVTKAKTNAGEVVRAFRTALDELP